MKRTSSSAASMGKFEAGSVVACNTKSYSAADAQCHWLPPMLTFDQPCVLFCPAVCAVCVSYKSAAPQHKQQLRMWQSSAECWVRWSNTQPRLLTSIVTAVHNAAMFVYFEACCCLPACNLLMLPEVPTRPMTTIGATPELMALQSFAP